MQSYEDEEEEKGGGEGRRKEYIVFLETKNMRSSQCSNFAVFVCFPFPVLVLSRAFRSQPLNLQKTTIMRSSQCSKCVSSIVIILNRNCFVHNVCNFNS